MKHSQISVMPVDVKQNLLLHELDQLQSWICAALLSRLVRIIAFSGDLSNLIVKMLNALNTVLSIIHLRPRRGKLPQR